MSKKVHKSYLNQGAPRKWDYKGVKRPVSIRLTNGEKKRIKDKYNSIQAFIQLALERLL